MRLQVRTATGLLHTGRTFTIEIINGPLQEVDSIKRMIKSESGIPVKFQKLIYRGKLLEGIFDLHNDYRTIDLAPNGGAEAAKAFSLAIPRAEARSDLSDHNPTNQNSIITILIKWCRWNWSRTEVRLNLAVKDLLMELPELLSWLDGENERVLFSCDADLIYNGTRLQEGYLLSDYNIRNDSTLDVVCVPGRLKKGIGSDTVRQNRNKRVDRALRPLLVSLGGLPLNFYPKALVKVTSNDQGTMFLALQKTLAPILAANGGSRRRSNETNGPNKLEDRIES